jgi:pimeloyl-ACP methyl ester carboxylesterase
MEEILMNKYYISSLSVWRAGYATTLSLTLAATLVACSAVGDHPPALDSQVFTQTAASCAALVGTKIPASQIGTAAGLASGDATVTSASMVAAKQLTINAAGNAVATPANPEYCEVRGSIAPVMAGAQPIGFQANLPTTWNKKMVQFGGSGLNGSLITATGYISTSTNTGSYDTPLNRGYITVGTDSGHLRTASPRNNSTDPAIKAGALHDFGLNDEMLRNFGHESYKKVRDTALALTTRYYGVTPGKSYYFGGSEGGREALTMAQRYPADYDGVFARSPVIHWTGLFSAFIRTGQNQLTNSGAAYLGTEDIKLLYQTVLSACDARDGIVDGVVGDYLACKPFADAAILTKQCTGPYTAGTCFTVAQIGGINLVHSPTPIGFALANGATQYPAWLYGGETKSYAQWKAGKAQNAGFGTAAMSTDVNYGFGVAKYFFAQNQNLDVVNNYDPLNYQTRIQYVSSLMDSTNPDLRAFNNRNGKVLIVDCTADWAKSSQATFNYYDTVVARMGQGTVNNFMRLYVSPSAEHGCGNTITMAGISPVGVTTDGAQTSAGTAKGMPVNVDWVTLMENWVEKNQAPGQSVVATRNDPTPPFTATSAEPLCHYPLYPKYTGTDPTSAASYTCVASGT